MQNLPHYPVSITNTDNNQYNVQGIDLNLLKNFFDNNNNNNIVMQNGNSVGGLSYMQPKLENQYYINVPFQQPYMVHMPHANLVYLNQPQFQNSDGTIQYSTHVLPMQLTPGVMQVDLNDLNKNNQNNNSVNSRSRKRTYNTQIKAECEEVQNETVPCDTKNRPLLYSCTECTRKFSTQPRLTQHKKCHSGIRPFVCGSCDFAFTQKSYLVRHAAVHKEERPYVCEPCQKSYKHYGSLANHRKTHRNGKSFVERPSDNEKNTSMNDIGNIKVDENLVDINNNSINSFVSNCNTDFHFQNQQDIQLNDVNQSYTTQYTTDLSTDILPNSSFQSQISADNSGNFINQLNSQNFYDLIEPESIAESKREILKYSNSASDVNNNSSISIESCQPINLT